MFQVISIQRHGVDYAQALDKSDVLSSFRRRFAIDDPGLIYVDGNSLGRLPAATVKKAMAVIEHQWGERLIRSWNEGWYELPEQVGGKLSRLVGAQPDEVIMADSTSVNLFKLSVAALRRQIGRTKIITDNLNFPSDLYILESVVNLAGEEHQLIIVSSKDGIHADLDGLASAIDEDTALVALSHTTFKSGYTYDMKAITGLAHDAGALMLWDTSHSVGVRPIEFNRSTVDLAVGCSYKYLNGGPGAPAFLFVRQALQEQLFNPLSGWMGQKDPFDFALKYKPTPGLRRFLSGTPPIISLALAEAGIDLIIEAGIEKVRAKSIHLSEYFLELWELVLREQGFVLKSPRDPARRGSHVTLGHSEGWPISQALIEDKNIIPDFRKPDNIRLGFAPLYNTFEDVYKAADGLSDVIRQRLFNKYRKNNSEVT